jgi:hypothetical protein
VRRRSSLAATIALVVAVGAGVSLGPLGASAVASEAKEVPPTKPPVITESFTLLFLKEFVAARFATSTTTRVGRNGSE